jgi:hypothetical protein
MRRMSHSIGHSAVSAEARRAEINAALAALLRPWLLRVGPALALACYLRGWHRRRVQKRPDDGLKFVFRNLERIGHRGSFYRVPVKTISGNHVRSVTC